MAAILTFNPFRRRVVPALVLRTRGRPLPVVARSDGVLGLKFERGAGERRCFVTSMPKAGTYLIGRLLHEAGLVDLEVHVDVNETSDYRGVANAQRLSRARTLSTGLAFEQSLSLVHEGQFAVGHVPFSERAATALADFAVIVALREPRAALLSMMRFEERRMRADPERGDTLRRAWIAEAAGSNRMVAFLETFGPELIGLFAGILAWLDQPGVMSCRFETLMGDDGIAARDALIARLLAISGAKVADPAALADRAINQDTLTFSGQRSCLEGIWDDRCEARFASCGGLAADKSLGQKTGGKAVDLRHGASC